MRSSRDLTWITPSCKVFAALKEGGTIRTWGSYLEESFWEHSLVDPFIVPNDDGYVSIFSANYGFAALKAEGRIRSWPSTDGQPLDDGYVTVYANSRSFAAIKASGSIAI